jgi:hypothetical protein
MCLTASLSAQQVTGTLRREVDSLPIAGALIVAGDGSGRDVAHTMSNETGSFELSLPASGTFQLRVLRIGHRPWGPQIVAVAAGRRIPLALFLPDAPVVLAALTVAATTRRCGIPDDSSVVGLLIAEARKAIALTEETLRQRRLAFRVETWQRQLAPSMATLDSVSVVSVDRGWPIRTAPAESLRIGGFVRDELDDAGNQTSVYFGPDATVLFADWFLGSRCLRLARSPTADGLLAVEFTPERRRPGVDIAGRFVFDSASLALRELQFRWTGLPAWVPREGPGGFLRFRRLPTGEWLATEWSLRAPAPEVRNNLIRLRGYVEVGGRARDAQ